MYRFKLAKPSVTKIMAPAIDIGTEIKMIRGVPPAFKLRRKYQIDHP